MSGWRRIVLPGADVALWSPWLGAVEADALFVELRRAIAWENHRIRLFGREVASPRLSCWIGDPGATYTYSRSRFEPQPWPAALAALRPRVEQACGARFNSVLANLYRDGGDAMGWHSDDEPELGARPVIASLSLGAERRFRLRRRRARGESAQPGDTSELLLPHGSLLRMAGDTQRLCRHELPRMRNLAEARINLTFRCIHTAAH
ncbi:alpha-ketoglutarate-dependent dioxygenase AlkB [Rhodanobacter sp. DHB23]|uniref:alpha-ketoglutarate-dependent dioxygenase AlkB family protein n=1 Tax=Rhodanobacter sp. DHB23 TaxID=2775923 RepID=UPI00177C234C|nr:alpha-ketoglutarate-dependent dioxygenase AlkB [Rhodanobacter sp. DHB23]MBD8873265.1 alpha-ketoglutarate-dependent dioxygenase AlkB [Rhodanobacter sp. DHB23]